MKITKHATKRTQQRGIKHDTLLLVSMFGEIVATDADCAKIQITERIRRNLIQLLDKCRDKIIVVDKNVSTLITAYTLSH